jgi:uncharacterized protein YukE
MTDVSQVLSDAVSFQDETTSQFETNMNTLSDYVDMAADNLPNAKTAMDSAETAIETAIHNMASKNNALRSMIKGGGNDSLLVNEDIRTLRENVRGLRERVGKARELEAVRKEQTRTLANRMKANFHSSWLGLLRPLREESRTGLVVAGVCFLLLMLAGLFFLYRIGFFTGSAADVPDFFQGGFLMKRFHR